VSDVTWIEPQIIRGVVKYPERCQAEVTTPEAIEHRDRVGRSRVCTDYAKINFRGKPLCIKHAKIRALEEVMGKP
jgi:hypothetical protein